LPYSAPPSCENNSFHRIRGNTFGQYRFADKGCLRLILPEIVGYPDLQKEEQLPRLKSQPELFPVPRGFANNRLSLPPYYPYKTV